MGSLPRLILRLCEIYKREPDAAFRALENPLYAFTDDDSLDPDLVTLAVKDSTERAQEIIARKTLVPTEIGPETIALNPAANRSDLFERLKHGDRRSETLAAEEGLTVDEYDAKLSLEKILDVDLGIELLRDFADRLDAAVELIGQLDDDHDYRNIPSKTARHFLREAHLNYLYGMESSACILFWSAIEHSLRELLNRKGVGFGTIRDGLNKAETHLGLPNAVRVDAGEIYELRKSAVHNISGFWDSDGELRATIPSKSRLVIAALYRL